MKYDLIIIGGGSGGLTIAAGAAKLGANVALIEKNKLGGECLWTGCVPSKAIISTAKVAHLMEHADEYGLKKKQATHAFNKVINRVQHVINQIEPHDSPERFRKLGVNVIFGNPQFKDKHTLHVGNKEIKGKNIVIATGSSPYKFPLQGLEETGYLTNETLFTHKTFPKTFLVIGGGPIGAEMAQAYARLGSTVHVFEKGDTILSKEDPELSKLVQDTFVKEGINVHHNVDLQRVEKKGRKKIIHYKQNGKNKRVSGDEILLAIGRSPNIEGLNLDAAGVDYDKRKIHVNERLQTSTRNIYAIGDVKGGLLFTHVASYEAGIVLQNTLFKLPKKADYSVVPWTTYTDPELARCGITEQDAKEQGIDHHVLKFTFANNDRAQAEGETNGLYKIIVDKKGYILGAHIVGPNAGELLPEFVLAMRKKLKITDIFGTIHTYPTLAGGNQQVAGKWYEKKLTPAIKKILQFIFRFG